MVLLCFSLNHGILLIVLLEAQMLFLPFGYVSFIVLQVADFAQGLLVFFSLDKLN
jgi:hypothetical protein